VLHGLKFNSVEPGQTGRSSRLASASLRAWLSFDVMPHMRSIRLALVVCAAVVMLVAITNATLGVGVTTPRSELNAQLVALALVVVMVEIFRHAWSIRQRGLRIALVAAVGIVAVPALVAATLLLIMPTDSPAVVASVSSGSGTVRLYHNNNGPLVSDSVSVQKEWRPLSWVIAFRQLALLEAGDTEALAKISEHLVRLTVTRDGRATDVEIPL